MKYVSGGTWELDTEVTTNIGEFRYKYCVLDERIPDGGVPMWEPREDRVLALIESDIQTNDTWGVTLCCSCLNTKGRSKNAAYSFGITSL